MNVFDLEAVLTLDTSEYDQGLSKAGEDAKRATGNAAAAQKNITTAALAGAGAMAAASTALVTKSIKSYAEYEQLVGGIETLYKSSANTVMQYANEAYKTAGMSANQYMETATSFAAALTQSLGGDTAKAAEYANTAIADMSDNANKMGTSIDSIVQTYQSLSRGNFAMLDNLKLGYGGTKAELERLLEDAERYKTAQGEIADYSIDSYSDIVEAIHVVQQEMGITGTTAAESASTIEGSFNTAKAAAENFFTSLANPDADVSAAFDTLTDSIATVAGNVIPVIGTIADHVWDLANSFPAVTGAVLPAAAAFGTFAIAINVVPAIGAVKTALTDLYAVLAANPIGLAIALTAGLAVAAYNLATHFSELYTEADKAAEGIRNLNRATESGVSGWVEQENAAKESMSGVQSSVESAASGVSDALGAAGADSGQAYRENLTNALSGIDADLAAQISAAMDGTAAAVDSYSSQMGAAGENAASQYASAWSGGEVANAVTGAMTSATEAATTATQAFTNVGQNIATQLASSISAGAGTVSSSVRNVVATAIMAGNAATGGATAIGANIARGIAAGISSGSGAIAAAARSAVQAAVAAAKAAAAISSPSKKFRDEVGVFMGLGIAEGLEDSEDKVVKAAKELAEKTYRTSKEWLRRQTKFNRLSLAEQLEVWQEIQSQYIKESKQWIQAEEEIFDLREKIQSNFADDVEKLWKNITDAQDKYTDALEKRIDDIAGAYKLFDDVQDREAVSGQELTENLTRQVNVLNDFYGGLDALAARGVSGDLVEDIRSMGPKAVDNLDALLAMTDEQLSEYADLYGQKQAFANAQATKELESLNRETNTQVHAWMQTIVDKFGTAADQISVVTNNVRDLEDELRALGRGGNVDLLKRPVIDATILQDVGWEDAGEGKATVFSSTFSDENGTRALNFTPIIVDKNGKFVDVLEPDALWEYAEGVIAGVQDDYLGLQIGAEFVGADAIEQAEKAAERVHELHEQYYLDGTLAKLLEQTGNSILDHVPEIVKTAVQSSRAALQETELGEWVRKSANTSKSALGAVSEQVINAIMQQQNKKKEPTTINLVMPDGGVLARYLFDPLKEYAAAKGQPIVNPA